ncbi:MAG: hypothetical protein ACLQNE_03995 [Thermoguttaceae bacterium]
MRSLILGSLVSLSALVAGTNWAKACACGEARHCHCACAAPCCPKTVTVMKTCQEVVYDEKQETFYKTVYEDVVEKNTVPCVKWVEETRYRCCPCTLMQPEAQSPCAPVATPGCTACAQPACQKMVPVTICRKVPYTVSRQVCVETTVEHKHTVTKQVPYSVTVCIPRVIIKQVPVEVCCPSPCCNP